MHYEAKETLIRFWPFVCLLILIYKAVGLFKMSRVCCFCIIINT